MWLPSRRLSFLVVSASMAFQGCGGGEAGAVGDRLPEGVERVENPAEGAWGSGGGWRLVEDLRIGSLEGGGPDAWGSVGALAVDGAGRIYVLDNQAGEVRVFAPDGAYVRTLGRKGEGPGEISLAAALLFSPRGHLWIHDARNTRFTVYDTAGTFLGSHPIRSAAFLQGHRFSTDGALLQLVAVADGGEGEVVVVRSTSDSAAALHPVDTLPAPPLPDAETMVVRFQQGQTMALRAAPLPFVPQPERVVDPRGYVWTTAVDGSYRLVQHGLDGQPVRVVERAYGPVPVTDEERAQALEPFEGAELDRDRIPDVHPPFESVHVAESGHLWVWRHAGEGRMAWDVFGPEGLYLGEVAPPYGEGRFRLLAVESDAVYGVWRDELDVSWVVRLALEKPETG